MSVIDNVNGEQFVHMLRAGHRQLKQNVQVVNALNIFPVPDGDTGTNMEMSLAAGVAKLNKASEWALEEAVQAFASGLLMGARGNSGVILSQLFRGFQKVSSKRNTLDVSALALALHEGVQIAYRAVAKPVEGTILTVAREAAGVGLREAKATTSLSTWMSKVCHAAEVALAHTPEQLPVLKQAGVVDSGGQGLVFIYQGFLQYLSGESNVDDEYSTPRSMVSPTIAQFAAAQVQHEGEFGYCTEVLCRVDGFEADHVEARLREQLASYGDSLLVVSVDNLVKVHVHTLEPGRVLQDALKYGPLVKVKIENMTEQHMEIQNHSDTSEGDHAKSIEDSPVRLTVHKPTALIAVAGGAGLSEVLKSLGVDVVVEGGQTMNPSTEELADAVQGIPCDNAILLPNNKNIVMAARQVTEILGDKLHVVPTHSIAQGIAALMEFRPGDEISTNVHRMTEGMQRIRSGQVVRAVRDSVFQGKEIAENQYLGLVDDDLVVVGDNRLTTAMMVIKSLMTEESELLTVFYGAEVQEDELRQFERLVAEELSIELEMKFGGQPIYDYIFMVE